MIAPETINKMADYIQISYNFLDSKRIRSSYEDQEYLKLHELVTLISGKRYAQVRWDALEEFEKEMWDKRKELGLLDSGSIHDDAGRFWNVFQGDYDLVQQFVEFAEDKATVFVQEI
jgi:hypothetical protein